MEALRMIDIDSMVNLKKRKFDINRSSRNLIVN